MLEPEHHHRAENTAMILKASYGKGESNEALAIWRGYWSNKIGGRPRDTIPARFQPSDETAQIEFGSEWSKGTYRVYFDKPFPATLANGEYRVIDSEGGRYRIMRYYDEQRIDRLPVAICVRIVEGAEYVPEEAGGPI